MLKVLIELSVLAVLAEATAALVAKLLFELSVVAEEAGADMLLLEEVVLV